MLVTKEGARLLTGAAVLLTLVTVGFVGLAGEAEGSGELAWLAAFAAAFAAVMCGVVAWMAERGLRK